MRRELPAALWPVPAARPVPATAADESVDVGALARTIGRGWRTLLTGGLLGVLVGLALVLFVPAWYRGTASVLVRNANDPAGSLLSRFGIAGDIAGSAAGGALGGVLKSSLETEVQLLQSREIAGKVVDSLALQARVLSPRGLPAVALFAPGRVGESFRRRTVTFTRDADGSYQTTDAGPVPRLVPGRPGVVPGVGAVTLGAGPLPPTFRVQFEDREDAITRAVDHLTIEKLGGDVVKVRYSGPDSLTAAAVPNAAVAVYLGLRRTVDRGVNERRYEFMAAQADTAARQLAVAEDALARDQTATGVIDPELVGKSELEAAQQVRTQTLPLESERQAAHALVDSVERGRVGPRQLAAFPSFLRAPAINSILSQLTQLETERTRLLGTRTERDPDVVVLTQSIADLERGLLPLARTYATSLDRQVDELTSEQRSVQARLTALPGQAETALRRQRDVKRLSQVVLGLQAQMIDARLSALSEGGQVRQVDVAVAPKRPLFPRAVWTLPGGCALGVLAAIAWVLARGAWSSRVRSANDAERATGLPAVVLRPGTPLWLPSFDDGTVVVVGADGSAGTHAVADALAAQARARGRTAVVLGAPDGRGGDESDAVALREAVRRADAQHDAVYVAAPPLDDTRTAAVLEPGRAVAVVAAEGVTGRDALASVTETLGRLGVPVLGIVVTSRAAAARSRG
ncbi:hypothetical protein tb265_36380 [Gemmatimonadetes bacterium T265]|nr:hypothetical protein tb265_36380 [Gemmatimonadetes bacterium T265]